ncbi:thioesterase II family protein [Actinomadura scrupuli]|uniref:thioesterase II family protein n=1 Tax=Actinomadura scrupuli TaxID=559629 RepID=UPI003D99D5AA
MTQRSPDTETWIRHYHQAADGAVRLLCFPHAGGSASFYFPVSAQLSPAVGVGAVQYPGRQDRRAEGNIDNIPDLADAIFHAVRRLDERPLAFFGHSMGAVLAYEVALRLEQDGAAPLVRLVVSGRRAPSRHRTTLVHQQDDQGIIAELRRLSGTQSDLLGDPETVEMILPAIRNDYRAIETYRPVPGRSLSCPVVAYVGDQDPQVTIDEAKSWADHTTGPFDLRVFPGGHFYLIDRSKEIIQTLRDDLAAVR